LDAFTIPILHAIVTKFYRISYLPPPVLAVLNDKELKAAKRAAMITTVLQWIVTEVPTAGLPPPLLVVVTLLKGLVPILGYLGSYCFKLTSSNATDIRRRSRIYCMVVDSYQRL
jgi:hypothetical protein